MPGPASLFSPPLKGLGEAYHTENVGTHGPFVRSNTLIKPSIFHSCCIKRSGRTSRASLHTEACKLVLPSFGGAGGGLPCGECGDAWPIRPLKHAHKTKYIPFLLHQMERTHEPCVPTCRGPQACSPLLRRGRGRFSVRRMWGRMAHSSAQIRSKSTHKQADK